MGMCYSFITRFEKQAERGKAPVWLYTYLLEVQRHGGIKGCQDNN